MRTLEQNKLCVNLEVTNRIICCKVDRKNNPSVTTTAKCMKEPQAADFLKQEFCENYKQGGD